MLGKVGKWKDELRGLIARLRCRIRHLRVSWRTALPPVGASVGFCAEDDGIRFMFVMKHCTAPSGRDHWKPGQSICSSPGETGVALLRQERLSYWCTKGWSPGAIVKWVAALAAGLVLSVTGWKVTGDPRVLVGLTGHPEWRCHLLWGGVDTVHLRWPHIVVGGHSHAVSHTSLQFGRRSVLATQLWVPSAELALRGKGK